MAGFSGVTIYIRQTQVSTIRDWQRKCSPRWPLQYRVRFSMSLRKSIDGRYLDIPSYSRLVHCQSSLLCFPLYILSFRRVLYFKHNCHFGRIAKSTWSCSRFYCIFCVSYPTCALKYAPHHRIRDALHLHLHLHLHYRLVIQSTAQENTALPTSHTCFSTLNIPSTYESAEQLQQRFRVALQYSQGFGLI